MNVDTSHQNYWTALRMVRGAPTEAQRQDTLRGHFTLTMLTEKNPVIKALMRSHLEKELRTA